MFKALLMRFYDVDSGSVELDGVDIRELNIQWLRSKIGIVSQEPVLFNMSILENIVYGKTEQEEVIEFKIEFLLEFFNLFPSKIPMTDVVEVARAANINDRIQSLPEVFNFNQIN